MSVEENTTVDRSWGEEHRNHPSMEQRATHIYEFSSLHAQPIYRSVVLVAFFLGPGAAALRACSADHGAFLSCTGLSDILSGDHDRFCWCTHLCMD